MDITLPHLYTPRDYQLPFLSSMDSGKNRAIIVWPRRSGKDETCLNFTIKSMAERVGGYYYMFPLLNQGRSVLWDGINKDGMKFMDHFPTEFTSKKNDSEMKIETVNGSIFRVLGSDRFDGKIGTNPVGVVFSEYSLTNPSVWDFFRPILAENGGWAIFNGTPRGENHFFELYNLAIAEPDKWFAEVLTTDETKAIPQEVLEQERREIIRLHGNDALFRQEYFCDFAVPISGAYYAEQIMEAYKSGRVTSVPIDSSYPIDTWWDLGVDDSTSIWFTQEVGARLHLVDYYENTGQGLPHYIKVLQDRNYIYGDHNAPHDIEVREWASGGNKDQAQTRKEIARNMGINFKVCEKVSIVDRIEASRAVFSKCWFDSKKCANGIAALKNYHKQYDENRKTYLNIPYHDWSSHAADSFGGFAVGSRNPRGGSPMVSSDVGGVNYFSSRSYSSFNKDREKSPRVGRTGYR